MAYGVTAARELLDAMLTDRNRVAIATFGRDDAWLPPGTGRDHRVRAQHLLASHVAFRSQPPDAGSVADPEAQAKQLRSRLPDGAQILVLSPLLDDALVETIRRLDAEGWATSVISPDVTLFDGTGRTLAAIERENRIRKLRRTDVTVVDWAPQRPLAATIQDTMGVSRGRTSERSIPVRPRRAARSRSRSPPSSFSRRRWQRSSDWTGERDRERRRQSESSAAPPRRRPLRSILRPTLPSRTRRPR